MSKTRRQRDANTIRRHRFAMAVERTLRHIANRDAEGERTETADDVAAALDYFLDRAGLQISFAAGSRPDEPKLREIASSIVRSRVDGDGHERLNREYTIRQE